MLSRSCTGRQHATRSRSWEQAARLPAASAEACWPATATVYLGRAGLGGRARGGVAGWERRGGGPVRNCGDSGDPASGQARVQGQLPRAVHVQEYPVTLPEHVPGYPPGPPPGPWCVVDGSTGGYP